MHFADWNSLPNLWSGPYHARPGTVAKETQVGGDGSGYLREVRGQDLFTHQVVALLLQTPNPMKYHTSRA